jgi:photosystem II stability/assembly factor-like uncharacterized protein
MRTPRPTPRVPVPVLLISVLLLAVAVPSRASFDPGLLAGMKARAIGPATMSGRIAAIDVAPSDKDVIYVGAATGGLWKSADGGLTWAPVFEKEKVASIGAVAVSPVNPDVVWVGTGEGNPRNSASVGNGVYRTRDGGKTWEHLGLDESERITRVLLHPTDPDVVYVAALGTSWGENEQRGVFKTTDGGESWEKVLYVDERTGAADLEMDPRDPDKLLAAMWDHRRWPWFFRSGGRGSGLFLTRDGGRSWKQITDDDGLPKGDLGRIGLAIAPSDPRRVYALVESKQDLALYRSDDGGLSWRRSTTDRQVGNRPFYYADLRVDPKDPNRVYSLWGRVSVSEDGGKSFRMLVPFRAVHPDHHAMWIDPDDPRHLWEGNDGGIYESRDHGETWRFVANLPVAQYYHVRVDDEMPYNIYGGMQDNGSWKGPSEVWENGGIRNYHWREVGFGDGFDTAPVPGDPMRGFAMSQEGYVVRWDLRTGERKDVRPPAPMGDDGEPVKLRFNWNAALALDPFDANTVYFGSQFVHRSRDLGESWEVISPDLTTDNPEWQKQDESGGLTLDVTGAENFTSIVALAPSPVEEGVIWAGTDDGRLHVTRDGGESWTSAEGNLVRRGAHGVPENTWIPHIAPSSHDAGTAFAVFDNHRRSDWTPYVQKTTDFGETWTNLATDDLWGYELSIAQDPVDPDLLFLGTEFGLWVSQDGGGSWWKWTHGVPTVAVKDLAIQPRENDLVVGTHGRAAFVLDDYSPLREVDEEVLAEPLHLFPIPPAQQHEVAQTGSSRFPGSQEFRGENPPYGAVVTVSLSDEDLPHPDEEVERRRKAQREAEEMGKKEPEAEEPEAEPEERPQGRRGRPGGRGKPEGPKAQVKVADATGEVIREFEAPVKLGVNRLVWDLRRDSFKEPPRGEVPSFFQPRGPEVVPGTYTVTVKYGDAEASGQVEVLGDPRMDIPQTAREAKWAAVLRAGEIQDAVATAIDRIRSTRSDVEAILARAGKANKEALDEKKDEEGEVSGMEAGAASEAEGGGEGEEAAEGEKAPKGPYGALLKAGRKLKKGLTEQEKTLWTPPDTKGIPAENDAWSKVRYIQRSLGSSFDAPTPSQETYLEQAEAAVGEVLEKVNAFFADDVAEFRQMYRDSGLELLPEEGPVEIGSGE